MREDTPTKSTIDRVVYHQITGTRLTDLQKLIGKTFLLLLKNVPTSLI